MAGFGRRREGRLQYSIAKRLPLEQIAEAHELVERGELMGNIVLDIGLVDKRAKRGARSMTVNVVYTTSAVASGGRDGRAATADGAFEVKLARPKELGGNGDGNNPEQLFAAGYSACFLSAIQFVGSQEKMKVPQDTRVKVTVGLGSRSEGGFGLQVALEVDLPGLPFEEAEALVEKAHQICPYSNATRNNVDVKLSVVRQSEHA